MPLAIHSVRSLAEVVDAAAEFLSRPGDLFTPQRIVVPTAGAKAWLAAKLAERLGAGSRATGGVGGDGIIANVEFSYPGTIATLISADTRPPDDPWAVDQLAFTILELLARDAGGKRAFSQLAARAGGPLLAARRIADRFDHYHFRRPGMILEWEAGQPALSPEADAAGGRVNRPLARRDRWQFDLWRQVRQAITEPSPPARERTAEGPAPAAVLVAGLQGLSLQQIALLERLAVMPTTAGEGCDVEVLLVHPSPPLYQAWAEQAPPLSKDLAPARSESAAGAADPLVDAWLRGTRESQWLLASQGLAAPHAQPSADSPAATNPSLLSRMQQTVASGERPNADADQPAFDMADQSVRIHRCHDLSRQAEVLHEAILHAFSEIPDLAPHEVVILSPQIATLAPHLEAVFNREAAGEQQDNKAARLHLPLLVADRGIREVSQGAELLAAIIELIGSRGSVDAVLAVATHPLVLAHYGADEGTIGIWQQGVEQTKIRWGLDAARRRRGGLDCDDLPAHTWRLGLERMLLGAVMPDGDPEPVLGDVVPLRGVATADIQSLAPLVTIFGVLDELDRQAAESLPVAAWCDLLERTLGRLAGETSDDLAVPLAELDVLRQAAVIARGESPATVPVPWHDLKTMLAARLAAPVGRQPLRTGVITATSLIPLRGVSFRVVCLAGYDDAAVAPQERDSEDLAERQKLLGDPDRGLEVRRQLLDCLLAAEDRLIITCTGMSVKNNEILPLATPLAELTDFAARHGVPPLQLNGKTFSGIEVIHPRHACSRKNFVAGADGVLKTGEPFSHDAAALATAKAVNRPASPAAVAASSPASPEHEVIQLDWLAEFMNDPLWPYVRRTLGINPWRDDDLSIPATLPLELATLEKRTLQNDYLERLLETGNQEAFTAAWQRSVTANGEVPILGYGEAAIEEITQFSAELIELAAAEQIPLNQRHPKDITLPLEGVTLAGTLERCYPDADRVEKVVLVRPDAKKSSSSLFLRTKMLAVVQLLAVQASGCDVVEAPVFNQHQDWLPGVLKQNGTPLPAAQKRKVTLDSWIDQPQARGLLTELCKLYQQAAVRPFGTFGKTSERLASNRDDAGKTFTAFVEQERYAMSSEQVVYGSAPEFTGVFPDNPDVNAFFSRFHGLTRINRQYRYIPDAP